MRVLLLCVVAITCTFATTQFQIYVRPGVLTPSTHAALVNNSVHVSTFSSGALFLCNASSQQQVQTYVDSLLGTRRRQDPMAQVIISKVLPVHRLQRPTSSWALERVGQVAPSGWLPEFFSPCNGAGVTMHHVDTGIDPTHSEFQDPISHTTRAVNVFNAIGGSNVDCNGHGTGTASMCCGNTLGTANGTQIRSVKVLDCTGSGTTYTVAQGLMYVESTLTGTDVLTMSFGYGQRDNTVAAIISNLLASGVAVYAAAGNSAQSGCMNFPSAQSGVISVAASTSSNTLAYFSNYGGCIELIAPGLDVEIALYNSGSGVTFESGTSFSCPLAAGGAALWLQQFPGLNGAQVFAKMLARATPNQISNPNGTPNEILCVLAGTAPPTSASHTPTRSPAPVSNSHTPTRSPAAASHSRTPSSTRRAARSGSRSLAEESSGRACTAMIVLVTFCMFFGV